VPPHVRISRVSKCSTGKIASPLLYVLRCVRTTACVPSEKVRFSFLRQSRRSLYTRAVPAAVTGARSRATRACHTTASGGAAPCGRRAVGQKPKPQRPRGCRRASRAEASARAHAGIPQGLMTPRRALPRSVEGEPTVARQTAICRSTLRATGGGAGRFRYSLSDSAAGGGGTGCAR